ncbi:hypothetical protein BN172_5920025 [Clostridioides difficile T15]|nr:hypothetical protein BN172_5920025 [Clostridioides difficile T15]
MSKKCPICDQFMSVLCLLIMIRLYCEKNIFNKNGLEFTF